MKDETNAPSIWTIGHSTLDMADFLGMLHSFNIKLLADVRRYPGSSRYPHFNVDPLQSSLQESGIDYIHYPDLGGRRKPNVDSENLAWRNTAFRGYADYMHTPEFHAAMHQLQSSATFIATAYMCSEAPWWRCHRSLISDYLKVRGWSVFHIMKAGKATQHPFTTAAKIVNGKLDYEL